MDYAAIGKVLRAQRKRRGLSLDALAERLSTTHSNLSYVERGVTRPPLDWLERYAREVGVRIVVAVWPEDDARADMNERFAALLPRLPLDVVRTLTALLELWERQYPPDATK